MHKHVKHMHFELPLGAQFLNPPTVKLQYGNSKQSY